MSEIFGPWTPPGTGGTETTEDPPGPTTPATLTEAEFWETHTGGIVQSAEIPPWQRCKLGPYDLPGIVDVDVGTPPKRTIDAKAASGKGGETLTTKGWTGAALTITCTIWTPAQYKAWLEAEAGLAPELQDKQEAVDISSAGLSTRIKSVLIESVSPKLKDGSVRGTKVGTITAKQYVGTPKSASTGTAGSSKAVSMIKTDASYAAAVQEFYNNATSDADLNWGMFLALYNYPASWPEPP
jgi:hypothetical protein